MNRVKVRFLTCVFFIVALGSAQDALLKSFQSPPSSAKPHTWWHWMNGTMTREGMTADLVAMARVGIGGVQIFNAGYFPDGPVDFMTPAWRDLARHAIKEADRLGISVTFHNCAGWSSSGGPWNTPENAMQIVVTSETNVSGPAKFSGMLAQPPTRTNYYRDIAVLAVKQMGDSTNAVPTLSGSDPRFEGKKLLDGNRGTSTWLPMPVTGKPQYIQAEFEKPFTARSLTLLSTGGKNSWGGELQSSADGQTWKTVKKFGVSEASLYLGFDAVSAARFRILFTKPNAAEPRLGFSELVLGSEYRIDYFPGKSGVTRESSTDFAKGVSAGEGVACAKENVLDLSSRMKEDGSLGWDVPAGNWTIIRFGHTANGRRNHPAPKTGTGLEVDKLSREALDIHWKNAVQPILDDSPGMAGKTLVGMLIDSYEVGCQNYTKAFRDEFKKRRGYDLLPFLPALTGRAVESPLITERFLWDYRRTLADLFNEYYFGHFQELCHKNKLQAYTETYGNGNFDNLQAGGFSDMPMTEFWTPGGYGANASKQAASIARTYGHQVVGAESFTATPEGGRWLQHPYNLKPLGDFQQCAGVNRFIFHCYAHQPWTNILPGMTMGPWGTHFSRTQTWWEQASAWFKYLARTQSLLQQGLFAADVCVFAGEETPGNFVRLKPDLPRGYDYDGFDRTVLLTRMTVKDGKLTLPDGMQYRVMLLPLAEAMTPEVLRKIRDLIHAGATVMGTRPSFSPSLKDYPACDGEIAKLAAELWGEDSAATNGMRTLGKGRLLWGTSFEALFATDRLPPDFEAIGGKTARFNYIHRRIGEAEVYFVANQNLQPEEAVCRFRMAGKRPEFFHPDTGLTEPCPVWREIAGITEVPVRFDPAGSVFVVFREKSGADHFTSITATRVAPVAAVARKLVIAQALYGAFPKVVEEPKTWVDVTSILGGLVKDNALSVTAGNALAGDPVNGTAKELRLEYNQGGVKKTLTVNENQRIEIPANGTLVILRARYGLIPDGEEKLKEKPATAVDLTAKIQALVTNGCVAFTMNNAFADGDPVPMVQKELRLEYSVDGKRFKKTAAENQLITLPEDATGGFGQQPQMELSLGEKTATLAAWQAGTWLLSNQSGKAVSVKVDAVPAPILVNGPWELRFQAGRGAPEKITLEKLMPWNEHTESGVKYFSGTGTYRTTVKLGADQLRKDRRFILDLGRVEISAELSVNGKDLGILWKAPYRIDLGEALKAGENILEVKVVNLWPNRLIGDEQLPEDALFAKGSGHSAGLLEWPEWLLKGTPRTSGRLTFTTWKHWRKDDALVESGLIGPVTLRAVEVRPVPK